MGGAWRGDGRRVSARPFIEAEEECGIDIVDKIKLLSLSGFPKVNDR
jgi:hypothetical protein